MNKVIKRGLVGIVFATILTGLFGILEWIIWGQNSGLIDVGGNARRGLLVFWLLSILIFILASLTILLMQSYKKSKRF